MKGHFFKPNCKCPDKTKKCTCGATWSYLVDTGVNPKTGGRKQKKKGGFRTRKESEAAAAIVIAEVEQGIYTEEPNITFEEFSSIWLKGYQSTGDVKISTIRVRKHEINKLMPYFKCLKMKSITGAQYQDALNDLKINGKKEGEGLASNTLEGVHCTGRMIFSKAMERKVIKEDPTQYATVPKTAITVEDIEQAVEIPKYLEKEELAILLKTTRKQGLKLDYELFRLLSYSGMRGGEVCALQWKDINFAENTIRITKTYYNPNNNIVKYQLLPPKTKTSIRIIEIDPGVIEDLRRLKSQQATIKLKYRQTYHDKDFVFVNLKKHYGYPLLIKIIENRMKRLLKIAKLNQNLTPHSLRHTHTSLLAEAGASLEEIMQRLGHKDDETTRTVYLHVTKPMKKGASRKFSELMKGL